MLSRTFRPIFAAIAFAFAFAIAFLALTAFTPANAQTADSARFLTPTATPAVSINETPALAAIDNHGAVVMAKPLGGRGELTHRLVMFSQRFTRYSLTKNLTLTIGTSYTRANFDTLNQPVLKLPPRSIKTSRVRFVPWTYGRAGPRDAVTRF